MVRLFPERNKECNNISFDCENNDCAFRSVWFSFHTSHHNWDQPIPFHIDRCPLCGSPLKHEWDD